MVSKSKNKLFSSGQQSVILHIFPAFQLLLEKTAGKTMQAEEGREEARYYIICTNALT